MSQSSFCQDIYPKVVVIERDTLVVLKPYQIKQINSIIVDRDFLRQEVSLLNDLTNTQNRIILNKDSQIQKYQETIASYETSVSNLESSVNLQEQQLRNYSRKALGRGFLIGGGCIIVGVVVGFLIAR